MFYLKFRIMKINKSYSLSQFIYEVEHWLMVEQSIDFPYAFNLITRYNDEINKPLNKGMFIKEFCDDNQKVIFSGNWKGMYDNSLGIHTYKISDGKCLIEFYNDGTIGFMDEQNYEYEVESLKELFEITMGKLSLINFEL